MFVQTDFCEKKHSQLSYQNTKWHKKTLKTLGHERNGHSLKRNKLMSLLKQKIAEYKNSRIFLKNTRGLYHKTYYGRNLRFP